MFFNDESDKQIFQKLFNTILFTLRVKENCCIWVSDNPQVIDERPEKVTLWCDLWSEDVLGCDTAQYVSKSGQTQCQRSNFTVKKKYHGKKNILYVIYLPLLLKPRNMDNPLSSSNFS